MKKIVCKNYDELSKIAAGIIQEQINAKPDTVLGLATGSTPIGTYKELINRCKQGELDFSNVTTFNLDEYYKIPKDNPQSYHYFMHQNLFNHINIKPQNVNIPNGYAENVDEECDRYEGLIEKAGGVDLQVLGIGSNGHIGFNEPAAELNSETHMTKLTETTVRDNSRFFDNIEDVPKNAITMGIGTIFKAKKIILLISGKNKAEVAQKIFEGKISTDIPATLLQLHSNTTVIIDEDAACK